MISFNLLIIKSFNMFFGNIHSICLSLSFLLERSRDSKAPTCFSVCFSKAFHKGEYANLARSIICLRQEGIIYLRVRYSYLTTFPDDNADIFATSLLISYCSFSSVILSSILITGFYILSKRFFLKRERLSDTRLASITKKEYSFTVHFL